MHISAKICLALGLVAGIIGAVLMAIGVDTLSDIEEFQYEGITSGELSVDDKDGKGDLGFTIYIEGEPGDSDQNGRHDFCDNVSISASHNGSWVEAFTTEWETVKQANTSHEKYYNEIGGAFSGCDENAIPEQKSVDGKSLVKIGRACWGCMEGTMTINSSSNTSMWISYDDENVEEAIGGILGALAGGGCICCAGIFIVIGIILAIAVKGDPQGAVMATGTFQPVAMHENPEGSGVDDQNPLG